MIGTNVQATPGGAGVTNRLTASQEELLRLRLAVEASGEVIFMTDAGGTITYVNPEFERVYGYAPVELVGRTTPRILKGGTTTEPEYASFWRDLRERRVVRREFRNRTKTGEVVSVECSANPIVMNGELLGFLAVQRDITARKTADAAMRESEARYRTLAEAAHDSIFIVNSDGRIEYANAISLKRLNVGSDEAIGKPLQDVLLPATAAEMWREAGIVFATGQRHYFEMRFDSARGISRSSTSRWRGPSLQPPQERGQAPKPSFSWKTNPACAA